MKTIPTGVALAGTFGLIVALAGVSFGDAGFGPGQTLDVKEFISEAQATLAPESHGRPDVLAFAGDPSEIPQKPDPVGLCGRLSTKEIVHERFTRTVVQIGGIDVGTLDEGVRKEFAALTGIVVCASGPVAHGKMMVETIAARQAFETSLCGRLSIQETVSERIIRTVVRIGGIAVGSTDDRIHEQFQRYGGASVCAFGVARSDKLMVVSLKGKSEDSDPTLMP